MSTNTVKLIDRIGLSLLNGPKTLIMLSTDLDASPSALHKEINHLKASWMVVTAEGAFYPFYKLTKAGVKWAKGALDKPN